jgi:hypothetical protein
MYSRSFLEDASFGEMVSWVGYFSKTDFFIIEDVGGEAG